MDCSSFSKQNRQIMTLWDCSLVVIPKRQPLMSCEFLTKWNLHNIVNFPWNFKDMNSKVKGHT